MALTTIQMKGAWRLEAFGVCGRFDVRDRFDITTGICAKPVVVAVIVPVLVMTEVSGGCRFFKFAVRRDGRPAELDRQQNEEEES